MTAKESYIKYVCWYELLQTLMWHFIMVYTTLWIMKHLTPREKAFIDLIPIIVGIFACHQLSDVKWIIITRDYLRRIINIASLFSFLEKPLMYFFPGIYAAMESFRQEGIVRFQTTGFAEIENSIFIETERTKLTIMRREYNLRGKLLSVILVFIVGEMNILYVVICHLVFTVIEYIYQVIMFRKIMKAVDEIKSISI